MDGYIKRETLMLEIEDSYRNNPHSDPKIRQMHNHEHRHFLVLVSKQPTADVAEVKHGKWLKTDAYPHRVYCSLCYETYVTNEEVIRGRSDGHPTYCREAKYCPHCGAKMDLT